MVDIRKELPEVKENISLAKYTTFKIGGPARYFFIAKDKNEIIKAVAIANKIRTPYVILGGGSNLLISDKGFDGFVVKIQNLKFSFQNSYLLTDAGILVLKLVAESGKRGLSGLEWAGGLPGTIGGAVRGNAGAFGKEIKDVVSEVECLDKSGRVRKLNNKQCRFSYRNSIFKQKDWIVLSVKIRLIKGNKKDIQSVVKRNIDYRKEKHPLNYPNAGSVFKNCDLNKIPKKIRSSFLHVIKTDPFPVVPTAYIISEAGLKGFRVGNAQVSAKHPNYIVNLGGAKAKDIEKLIKIVKEKVKKKFGIILEEEVQKII